MKTHMTHFREQRAGSRALRFGHLEEDEECEKEATTPAKAAEEKKASAERPAILEEEMESEGGKEDANVGSEEDAKSGCVYTI